MNYEELTIEGRNAVLEAFRSGKTIDKLFVQDGCQDGSINTIKREARKHDTIVNFVTKERLDQMSSTGHHRASLPRLRPTITVRWTKCWRLPGRRGRIPS